MIKKIIQELRLKMNFQLLISTIESIIAQCNTPRYALDLNLVKLVTME